MEQTNKVITISDLHDLLLDKYSIDIPVQRIGYYIGENLSPFRKNEKKDLYELEAEFIPQAEKILLLQYIGMDKEDMLNYYDEKVIKRLEIAEKVIKVLKGVYKA